MQRCGKETYYSITNDKRTAADARAQIAGTLATCLQYQWFLKPYADRGSHKVEPCVRLNPSTSSVRLHSGRLCMPCILGCYYFLELSDTPYQGPKKQYRHQCDLPNEAENHQIQTISIHLGGEVTQTL